MSVSSIGSSGNIAANISRMGDLLKNITSEQLGMENKLLKVAVAEKVSNTGHNLDIKA